MASRSAIANPVWRRLTAYQQQLLQRLIASARHPTTSDRPVLIASIAAAAFRLDNSGVVLAELHNKQLQLFGFTPTARVVPVPAVDQSELQHLLSQSPVVPLATGTVCQLALRAATCKLQIGRPGEAVHAAEIALPPPLRCQAYYPCDES